MLFCPMTGRGEHTIHGPPGRKHSGSPFASARARAQASSARHRASYDPIPRSAARARLAVQAAPASALGPQPCVPSSCCSRRRFTE